MIRHIKGIHISFIFGTIFGLLCFMNDNFVFLSSILFIIYGIHTFEYVQNKKKELEKDMLLKFEHFESLISNYKKENDKIKADFDSIKTRLNVSQMFTGKHS